MRKIFIAYDESVSLETETDVYNAYPWACEVVEVDGGWMVFESSRDADIWSNQQ